MNCICMQTFQDFELFFLGDKCPTFDKITQSEDFKYFKEILGDRLIYKNFDSHDGTSAQAINYAMKHGKGDYFIFLSNDDLIFPNHFERYVKLTEEAKCDIGIFNTSLDYGNGLLVERVPELAFTKIGHSELCVSKKVYKSAPPHSRLYGHDFEFIANAINAGASYRMFKGAATYIVNMNPYRPHNWG